MHQLITGSNTLIPADCYACQLWCPLPCHKWVWLNWYLSTLRWRWKAVLLQCLAVSADASSNQTCRKTLFIHKTICCLRRNWSFLCSVISQGKVVALDRRGGKWNHLSTTHRLITNYAKNYCNRTLIVKVIVENVVTCFLGDTVYIAQLCCSTKLPITKLPRQLSFSIGKQSPNKHGF